MATQPKGRFRRFVSTPVGRVVLVILAVLAVFGTYAYVSFLFAIPAILVFGLALPIWGGLKRPRFLAIVGLIVVVAVAPMANAVFTQEILTPIGLSQSGTDLSLSNGQAILQNATVTPYTGTTSTNFTWTVTVFPGNVPEQNLTLTPTVLFLYISTCPGATNNASPDCTAPYPLTVLSQHFTDLTPVPGQSYYDVVFHDQIGTNGIWAWQMGIYTNNTTHPADPNGSLFQLLVGDPTYNGIEGPVIGGFSVIYADLLPTIYFQDLLFLGLPFYFVLLLYMLFKNRERRRKEAQQRAPGPVPPASAPVPGTKDAPLPSSNAPAGAAAGPPAAPTNAVQEFNCPKCNAVVYAGEKSCWKCGATLAASSP